MAGLTVWKRGRMRGRESERKKKKVVEKSNLRKQPKGVGRARERKTESRKE